MTDQVRITVLVENAADAPGLSAEHGLAYWIEAGEKRILLDTGQGAALLGNAFRLGIELNRLDAIVLSHGHYDHTGGLADALRGNPSAAIYVHPNALKPKYGRNKDGSSREIGMPFLSEQALHRRRGQVVFTSQPNSVAGDLIATGPVPRVTEFEDTGGPFFLDGPCQKPDPLLDDQALLFQSTQGTVVLLGCAHSGVINTLRYVRQLTDDRPIHAVLGGMHLVNASEDRLKRTIDELRSMQIQRLGPAHCTGAAATAALFDAMPDRCIPCCAGTQFEFERAPETPLV